MGGDAHVIGYLAEACTPFYRVILGGGLVGYLLFLLLANTEFRSMVHSITGRLVTSCFIGVASTIIEHVFGQLRTGTNHQPQVQMLFITIISYEQNPNYTKATVRVVLFIE